MEQNRRLFDADERADLIRCLKKYHDANFTPGIYEHSAFGKAALLLEKTADSDEVVRCKDCIYWKRHTKTDKYHGACNIYRITKHESGFCDHGERRAHAKNDNIL